jgi:signal transduction histidine kinase
MFAKLVTFFHPSRVFPVLVAYRWASLLPALLLFIDNTHANSPNFLPPLSTLVIAAFANTVITVFNRLLNKLVTEYPFAIAVDLLFCAALLAASGGYQSPYYLYALGPLLAGAFFFQLRGAIAISVAFTPLYLLANSLAAQLNSTIDKLSVVTQLAGIWFIPILFAYPSTLLKDINRAREELSKARDELAQKHENLETAHRQLEIIHDLTILLQAAPDLLSVQERVLGAVTTGLGFSKAVVALVDPALEELGGWLVYPAEELFPATKPLPLKAENGSAFQALLDRNIFTTNGETLVQETKLNDWLNKTKWLVIPLYLREHPVGLLLVDKSSGLDREQESTLMTVANQAALALGTTLLCIDRARRLAIETEQNRIARDIHDTVAQSLFGIVYSLDACINMLPVQADEVRNELIDLRSLASGAHEEVRRSIFDLWPSPLTIELFMGDLRNYVSSCCRPRSFSIIFNNRGDFNSLSPGLRRTIYRMAQEALANSARHSGADAARLCLNVTEDQVYLDISDKGRGFDPSAALARNVTREHFGLHGIQERARAMSGECEIISQPGAGVRIMVTLPTKGGKHGA